MWASPWDSANSIREDAINSNGAHAPDSFLLYFIINVASRYEVSSTQFLVVSLIKFHEVVTYLKHNRCRHGQTGRRSRAFTTVINAGEITYSEGGKNTDDVKIGRVN